MRLLEVTRRRIAFLHEGPCRENGQALVEYALILGLVSVVAVAMLTATGGAVTTLLQRVTSALSSAL